MIVRLFVLSSALAAVEAQAGCIDYVLSMGYLFDRTFGRRTDDCVAMREAAKVFVLMCAKYRKLKAGRAGRRSSVSNDDWWLLTEDANIKLSIYGAEQHERPTANVTYGTALY